MSFLKRLFGKETVQEVKAEIPEGQKQEELTNESQSLEKAWLELIKLLTQDSSFAADGMMNALKNPQAFLVQYEALFDQWFSEKLTVEEIQEYPLWELFFFVLYQADYAAMNDWKAEAEEFISCLEVILKKYEQTLDHKKITNLDEMAPEIFEQIKDAIPEGFVLVNIDLDSDSYQLSVVPVEKAEKVKLLSEAVNGKIDWFWTEKTDKSALQEESVLDETMSYHEACKKIWKEQVPKSGQAETLYGELLRQIEKLRWEAQNNGNINWDSNFSYFCDFIGTELSKQNFSGKDKLEIQQAVQTLKNIGERTESYQDGKISDEEMFAEDSPLFAYVEDDLYDMLGNYVGYLSLQQPESPVYVPKETIYR